jgi:hypothetical protein
MGRADGRGFLMGCHEPLAGGVGAVHSISGLVWCEPGRAGGHFEMLQALRWMGWRAATLSRGGHQRRETWWDGGGCAETSYARRRE